MFDCICCGKKLGELIVRKGNRYYISGKVAFHLYDTHGLPVEVTEMYVNKVLGKENV